MINFYEEHRSGENSFFLEKNGDLAFPPHFHQNIEIAIILSGSQPITVNGEFFIAKAGSVVVVDNFAVHSYGECKSKENYLLILPNGALGEFNRLRNGKVFKTPYVCNMKLAKSLVNLIENNLSENSSEYQRFCAINLMMALIEREFGLEDGQRGNESGLINKILFAVQEKFKEDISLKRLAKEMGYAEGHLSRVFHQYFKESFPHYVNALRLDYIERELKMGEKNVTQLIFEAGFNSFQTYYRCKKQANEKCR
ncbi:MAG: helix-turn-helix transcriptional regulator [Clostridia bacterium]|nr:helix-turn-helix transcriptional regulator [Clostridia bacterium]